MYTHTQRPNRGFHRFDPQPPTPTRIQTITSNEDQQGCPFTRAMDTDLEKKCEKIGH